MIKLDAKNWNEILERLVLANFEFKYDAENNRVTFYSCERKETDSCYFLGFNYVGYQYEYYFDLDDLECSLESLISCAFGKYQELLINVLREEAESFKRRISKL